MLGIFLGLEISLHRINKKLNNGKEGQRPDFTGQILAL